MPSASHLLFKREKEGNLQPLLDHPQLASIIVKNKYPLPLTMELDNALLDPEKDTKLDIIKIYGDMRVSEGDKHNVEDLYQAGQFSPLMIPNAPTGAPI